MTISAQRNFQAIELGVKGRDEHQDKGRMTNRKNLTSLGTHMAPSSGS